MVFNLTVDNSFVWIGSGFNLFFRYDKHQYIKNLVLTISELNEI
jgi:hypothetical protein